MGGSNPGSVAMNKWFNRLRKNPPVSQVLKGHDFSRAASSMQSPRL